MSDNNGLTERQVMALSTLFTQVLLNPDGLKFLLDDPEGTLKRAGIPADEIDQIKQYFLQAKDAIEKAIELGLAWWA